MSIQILISVKGHNSVENKPKMFSGLYIDGRQAYSNKFTNIPWNLVFTNICEFDPPRVQQSPEIFL